MKPIKQLRKYYWITQAFVKRYYKLVVRTILFGTVILGGITLLLQYIPTYRSNTRVAVVGKYTLQNLPQTISSKVSLGLVQIDEEGNYLPGIAKSWEISEDGKVYSFKINDKLLWHDNKPVATSDIQYNFQEVTQKIEGDTLTYTLQEPFSPFLSALSRPHLRNDKIGVGEYKIIKHELYNGYLLTLKIGSTTETITYRFYPTESSALTAYKLGEVDQIQGLSYVPEEIKKEPRNLISPYQEDSKIAVLFLNNSDVLLSSKPTRQALAYSISDKSFGNKRILSPISSSSWAYNDNVKAYDFDLEHANSLFKTDIQNPSSIKLELKTMLQYLDIAEKIAEEWENNLGIEVDVKVVAGVTTDYQILLADYAPPIDPDQYSIWHSTQSTNFTHFTNLKVDKLLEDGRRTLDKNLRTEIYQDFQRFLLEDCPAIFLFETSSSSVSRRPIFK